MDLLVPLLPLIIEDLQSEISPYSLQEDACRDDLLNDDSAITGTGHDVQQALQHKQVQLVAFAVILAALDDRGSTSRSSSRLKSVYSNAADIMPPVYFLVKAISLHMPS